MDSQLLVRELERLRAGHDGAETRVLFLISRSSLLLLTENDTSVDDSTSLVVKPRLTSVNGEPTASFFSSESRLIEWCESHAFHPFGMPVHGGDLPLALPKGTWIQIDPDSPYATLLSPAQLDAISGVDSASSTDIIVAPPVDKGFVSPVEEESVAQAPTVYRPVDDAPQGSEIQGPSKKRFMGRSHPTTLFTAPQIQKKEELTNERQRTYTSSNLRKVIRSNRPEGEGEE